MDILWPGFLFLLTLIPLLIGVYIWIMRRRRVAVRYSSLSLVRAALPRQSQWRRHLPFVLFLLALASLTMAMSRPVSIVRVPSGQVTVILALDVSRSMCSTDILPSRLDAAKTAAVSFVARQNASMQIGVVAFAGFAEMVQAPTTEQKILKNAILSLTTGRRTAIGSAIIKSLNVIAEIDETVAPVSSAGSQNQPPPVAEGAYVPHIIVLLTDGANNYGPEPVYAAQQAADRGVRVYTIGFGTAQGGERPICAPVQVGNEPPGDRVGFGNSFGGGGGGFRRGIDEETLKEVAALTDGEYYSAESAGELQNVFHNLPTYLITKTETTEISVAFAALGAVFVMLGMVLGLLWQPLP